MRLLPWLILVVLAVGIRANRNSRVLLLLAPLALAKLAYMAILFGLSLWVGQRNVASSQAQFDVLFYALVIGITGLWLAAPALEGKPVIVRILAAMALMVVIANLVIVSFGTASSQETKAILAILSTLGAVLVLTPAASARVCRQVYRPTAFMLNLAAWLIVGSVLSTLGLLAILAALRAGPSVSQLPQLVIEGLLIGTAFGLILYALYVPYMLLGFAHPFFRERMQACLNLNRPAVIENGS